MYNKYYTIVTVLIWVTFSGSLAQIPGISLKNESSVYANKGSNVTLTCHYSSDATSLLDYTVVWQFSPKGDGPRQKLSKNRIPEPNTDSKKYSLHLDYLDVGVDVSITIKNISESDDGRYICLLLKNADDAEVRTTDLKLIVPVPIQELEFTATLIGTNRTKTMKVSPGVQNYEFDKAENFEEGMYKVLCSASGSNPVPDVQLYKNKTFIKGKTGNGSNEKQNIRTFSAFVEGDVMIDKNSDEQRLTCQVNVAMQNQVTASFVISNVYSRDPRVNCEPVSVVQINSDRVFKCSVQVDKGPVKCSYVYWVSGESDDRYDLNKTYPKVEPHCSEVNQTYLESSLTLKNTASNSFSKTYIIVYRGSPHHNTVRKEAQLDTDSNSKSRTESCVSLVFGPLLIAILTLWY